MDGKVEGRKESAAAAAASAGLDEADRQIEFLKERFLPHIPHLLTITTAYPFRPEFPYEKTLFPKNLQYLTLVADGDCGIVMAKGNWEEEFAATAGSGTPTPDTSSKDKDKTRAPAVKYSIKDYKNMKQTGVRPSPRSTPNDVERKPGHSRNISNISLGTPMSRVESSEGQGSEGRQNGAVKVAAAKEESHPEAREKARPFTNGNAVPRDSLHLKDSNSKVSKPDLIPTKHTLPPRPHSPSPSKDTSDSKPQKRALDSATAPPEKRTKIELSRTPSGSQSFPRRPEQKVETKPSPFMAQKQQTQSSQESPQSRKENLISRLGGLKQLSKPNSPKTPDIPPLLSPLPADLDSGPASQSSGFSSLKKPESGKNSSSNTPLKSKVGSDTIVVKSHRSNAAESSPLSTPPKSQSPFKLPQILSPGLPDVIEQELLRLQQKAQSSNTVEARHEKARQPGAPGVAQKAPRTKVGHPPKRSQAESSKSQEPPDRAETSPTLIVKLKYKKSRTKTIERMLNLRPTPNKESTPVEPARKGLAPSALARDFTSDSEEETPLAKKSVPTSRKRPSVEPPRAPESKRVKSDIAEATRPNHTAQKHPFKSPAVTSAPPDRNLLSTPKKGDSMKTVAMRRVDSNDGNARTPQATSTPASAEKPSRPATLASPEIDRLKAEERRYSSQALKLKHKMDDTLKTKNQTEREKVTEEQRKLGLSVGLECIVFYMNAFSTNVRIMKMQNLACSPANWESLLKLWEFVDRSVRNIPVLCALSSKLGALCRDELRRAYLDSVVRDGLLDLLKSNEKAQGQLWKRVQDTAPSLVELGVDKSWGPWSTVSDTTTFARTVLGAFSDREGLGWVAAVT
ncbi:hypothetical protein LSUE1_G008845 [Lachnellula suecica]|uniref:Uncharacterized protein n=1 Tax=Lachnellula suecica TaxID=602035 RepID=A0A8T9BY66_9HELO|nr:hypothetical protein LSUE1_G008845 [Lachnellula suecica]